jgi:hypothetical protein
MVDIIVYDVAPGGDPCDGPVNELFRFTVSCDEVNYSLPSVGTAVFPATCIVYGPFFVGIEYTDTGAGPFPSIMMDNNPTPVVCDNWLRYGGDWWEWYDIWSPIPGYPIIFVAGETNAGSVAEIEREVISAGGLRGSRGTYELIGTLGQVGVGIASSMKSYGIYSGFWGPFAGGFISDCVAGDANGDGEVNIGDAVFLIGYIFLGGSAPGNLDEGDANSDCEINVGDVVFLIAYVFNGGPPPDCGCASGKSFAFGSDQHHSLKREIPAVIGTQFDGKNTLVSFETPIDIYGLQLEFYMDDNAGITNLVETTDLYSHHSNGMLRAGLLDINGKGHIPAGKTEVLIIAGEIELTSALAADRTGLTSAVTILPTEKSLSLPMEFSLNQNYPNPFNPATTIRFDLPQACRTRLDVYNITGQRVISLVDQLLDAGSHSIIWDGKNASGESVASGIYLYKIKAEGFQKTRKMVLLK